MEDSITQQLSSELSKLDEDLDFAQEKITGSCKKCGCVRHSEKHIVHNQKCTHYPAQAERKYRNFIRGIRLRN